jgi:DNA-binding NtrC family response regulator
MFMDPNDRAEVKIVATDPNVRQSLRALLEAAGYRAAEGANGSDATTIVAAPSNEVVPLAELERRAIEHALRVTGGRVAKAAKLLGIGRATLYRRLAARQARPTPAPSPTTSHSTPAPSRPSQAPAFH